MKKTKPSVVNQQSVVYSFQCDLCDAGYVGYTRGHLHNRVKGHKQQSSAIAKNMHGTIPQDLLKRFEVLKKCRNKFDFLVYEMLFIRALKPNLNVQSDIIRTLECYFFAPKKIALNAVICMICYIFLDNGVMTTPKRRILSFIFTVLCFKI